MGILPLLCVIAWNYILNQSWFIVSSNFLCEMDYHHLIYMIITDINCHLFISWNVFVIVMECHFATNSSGNRYTHVWNRKCSVVSSMQNMYVLCLKQLPIPASRLAHGQNHLLLLSWCLVIFGYQISSDDCNSQQ